MYLYCFYLPHINADLIACPASLYPICVQRSSEARRTLGRLAGQSTDLSGWYVEYLLDLILSNNLRVLECLARESDKLWSFILFSAYAASRACENK